MQTFQSTYQQGTRRLTALFLLLFSLHFVTIHGIAHALVLCFEANGDINIESVTGSFLTIPAEDALHAEANHNHSEPTYDTGQSHHTDISFASVCSKEQQTTRFDQQKAEISWQCDQHHHRGTSSIPSFPAGLLYPSSY